MITGGAREKCYTYSTGKYTASEAFDYCWSLDNMEPISFDYSNKGHFEWLSNEIYLARSGK